MEKNERKVKKKGKGKIKKANIENWEEERKVKIWNGKITGKKGKKR